MSSRSPRETAAPEGAAPVSLRPSWVVPPPGGATFASFVLFAALAGLVGLAYAGSEWISLAGGFGFPTDAAWVRAVFARSLAAGHGFTFNAGAPVAGVAAPSWILALAVAALPSGDFIVAAKLLGVISVAIAAWMAWGIARRLLEDWRFAFLAGLLVVISPLLASQALGGTEGPFAAMLLGAAIYWQAAGWEGRRWQRIAGAVAAGLAALTRPELLLLLPLLLLDRIVVAVVHGRGKRRPLLLLRGLGEAVGATLLLAPYSLYNRGLTGHWVWQQPEFALRAQPQWAWTQAVLQTLWASNPVLLAMGAVGLVVAVLSASRAGTDHPTYLPVLVPLTLLIVPPMVWPDAAASNAAHIAAALLPLIVVLGLAGFALPYRVLRAVAQRARNRAARMGIATVLGVVVLALVGLSLQQHRDAWLSHGDRIKKVNNLQVYLGRWAAQHLPPDASIASRDVGAIGYFSERRMVDLGGTISSQGVEYLRRPGAFDSNLLAFLQEVKPSHLAIRPSEIPDLAKRPELLTAELERQDTDPNTQGVTTLTLYETQWKPASVRALTEGQARPEDTERRGHTRHRRRRG